MKIGIIGAGFIGATLAKKLVNLGHNVFISHRRGKNTLSEVVQKTGATAVEISDAIKNVDFIIITIPQKGILDLVNVIKNIDENIVVIDTGNYYPQMRDGIIEDLEGKYADTEWSQLHLGRPIIKAFNNIASESLLNRSRPNGDEQRIALTIAGDIQAHKEKAMQLVDELGFDPIDGGNLKDSWRYQPGSDLYSRDLTASAVLAKIKEMGTQRTPELWEYITNNRNEEEQHEITNNPNDHYGHPNFKRVLDL